MNTGRSKPRLRDVAKAAKVSIATASMALADHPAVNADTKRRVMSISRRLGYRRAPVRGAERAVRGRRFGLMILGSDVHHVINAPFFYHLSSAGLEQDLRFEYAATSPALPAEATVEHTLRFVHGLDGVLLMGPAPRRLLDRLREERLPHVMVGHAPLEGGEDLPPPVTVVTPDDLQMGFLATRRLLVCGRRRVAFFCEILPPGMSHDQWLRGYRLAHLQQGLPVAPELVVVTGKPEVGAAPAMDQLLALALPPDGYSIPDTRLAAGVISELRQRGVELSRDAMIFNGVPNVVRALGLGQWPRLIASVEQMAQQSIVQLQRLCDHPDAAPLRVVVPFEALDLPPIP